ncbi:MAG: hypothetical protein WAT21_09360 [Saprospiraceae bacterium]
MTVCVGFLDEDKNGILMADSSKWRENGDLYGSGYLKIKQLELNLKCSFSNLIKTKRRSIGIAFAGYAEAIEYIMSSIKEPILVDDFNISKSINLIGNLFHSLLRDNFGLLNIRVDIIIMGFCDYKGNIIAYKLQLNPSTECDIDRSKDEYLIPGKGPAVIGGGLDDDYFETKSLENMYKCFMKRKVRGFQISEPIKYGMISIENKNFKYKGDYVSKS